MFFFLFFIGVGGCGFFSINLFILKIPIFPYDRILSALSQNGTEWEKEPGVRIDVGGLHNSCQVYYPKVIKTGDSYRMYYRAGGYKAFVASACSNDGLQWEDESGIRIGLGGKYNIVKIESCDITYLANNRYRMYYSGFDGEFWRIYYSESEDGLEWGDEDVCIDVSDDSILPNAKCPSIVKKNQSEYQLFFMRFSSEEVRIFSALSPNGIRWGGLLPCHGLSNRGSVIRNPCVKIQRDGGYRIFFSERPFFSNPIGARIKSAISCDGIDWVRENKSIIEPGNDFDKHGIFSVDIIPIEGGWRMYYAGYWGRHWLEPLTLHRYRSLRNGVT